MELLSGDPLHSEKPYDCRSAGPTQILFAL
jgi:hypothetical protein